MPITVEWFDDEQTIILLELKGKWDWEALYKAGDTIAEMMQSVEQTVDQVIDVTNSTSLPSSAITNLRNASLKLPANSGTRVLVGSKSIYQVMFKMLSAVFPQVTSHIILVDTREEAHELLLDKREANTE